MRTSFATDNMPSAPARVRNQIDRINRVSESNCVAIVKFVVGRLMEPMPEMDGVGCVIAAGGKYLKFAYVTVSRIREQGWTIPIEIWHLGPKEVSPTDRAKFDHLDVTFVDALVVARDHPMRNLGGWQLKGYAVKHTRFRHVLLLDSDCVPRVDPEPLFQSPEYLKHGAIFWPDIRSNRPNNNIFSFLGLKYDPRYIEVEAGQLMVDKARNWPAVCLMNWMNSHSDFFYRHFHGDKETWPLSWLRLGRQYLLAPSCSWHAFGIRHYWFDGQTVFDHHMNLKRHSDAEVPTRHQELLAEFEPYEAPTPPPFVSRPTNNVRVNGAHLHSELRNGRRSVHRRVG